MDNECLSYAQALNFCEDYQYLVGRPFEKHSDFSVIVKSVVVVPYGCTEQEAVDLEKTGQRRENPSGKDGMFEVVVTGQRTDGKSEPVQPKLLRDYIREHDLILNLCNYNDRQRRYEARQLIMNQHNRRY